MVSANGRVITVRAAKPCGHRPLLLARSSPDRVTLRLVNRDVRDCHVEAVGVISVSVTLPRALGSRQLVQAVNGKPIKYRMTTVTPASKEPGQQGVSAKALACERRQKICNRAAWRALPLRSPDGAGAALMTEAQAIAAVGWRNGDKVGAHLMTYGQAMASYPSLAAEDFIDSARQVWVITLYYPSPEPNPGSAPAGVTLPMISSATIVLDAATGTETDWCLGCSSIPSSASAAHAAVPERRQ